MEFYDSTYTQQLAPFIALNIGEGVVSSALKQIFERHRIHRGVWDNAILRNRLLETKFILQYFESETAIYRSVSSCKSRGSGEHAVDSPFHPDSDLFPNGILSLKWFTKYINKLPFAIISVYHLHPNRTHDGELGATLASLKSKYSKFGIKHVSLLVSSGKDTEEENNRIKVLRQISESSSNNGIFYLNTNTHHFQEDCEVLVSSILNNLKSVAADFYSAIEARIRLRHKKYYTIPNHRIDTDVELSPKILEVRNLIKRGILLQFIHPNNLDYSLPILEEAYEAIIELLKTFKSVFFSSSIKTHDSKLFTQYRTLLDVITIHIVRGCFSIEQHVASLRKHSTHIKNVLELLNYKPDTSLKVWEAVQYQWLAELLYTLPKAILSDMYQPGEPKSKSNVKTLVYYGGISFRDNFSTQVVIDPCSAYMKAASKLKLALEDSQDTWYPPVFPDSLSLKMHRIFLMKSAGKLLLETKVAGGSGKSGFQSLLAWEIAEEYAKLNNYDEAIHHYNRILSGVETGKWGSIEQLTLMKTMEISEKLGKPEEILRWVPRLFPLKINEGSGIPPISLLTDVASEILVDSVSSFWNTDFLIFNKTFGREIQTFDTILMQIVLSQRIRREVITLLFPESEITCEIKSMDVSLTDNLIISLVAGGPSELEFEVVEIGADIGTESKASFGGLTKKSQKVIQLDRTVTSSGWFGATTIKISTALTIKRKGLFVNYIYNDYHEFALNEPKQFLKLKCLEPDGSLLTRFLMPESQTSSKVFVRPYRPNVKLKCKMSSPNLVVGEKLKVPFEFSHLSSSKKVNITSVFIELQTHIQLQSERRDDMTLQTSWESLKDDQPVDILEFLSSGDKKLTKMLQVCVRGQQNAENEDTPLFAVVIAKMIVKDFSGDEVIFDLDEYRFHVVVSPFKPKVTIGPVIDVEKNHFMPSPFILNLGTVEALEQFSMPLSLRVWVVKAVIDKHLKLNVDKNIEVILAGIELKPENSNATLTRLGDVSFKDGVLVQYFTTESNHRFQHPNMNISVALSYEWKRRESELANHFEPEEVQFIIPLQNPRLLMRVVAKENDTYRISYTIENPTPKILTFTAKFDSTHAEEAGSHWLVDETKTIAPTKQTPFPVLPFSQFALEYEARINQERKEMPVVLPTMHVYDVNYKVSLPTLPADDNIVSKDAELILKI